MWALKKWCVTKVAHCIHLRLRDGSKGQKKSEDHVAYQIKGKRTLFKFDLMHTTDLLGWVKCQTLKLCR